MARMMQDFKIKNPKGIAADERTAICVDEKGNAIMFGTGKAFFISANKKPAKCTPNKPLTWDQKDALAVWSYQATEQGTAAFNLNLWPTQKPNAYWSVKAGELIQSLTE
jgi:cyanophycinase